MKTRILSRTQMQNILTDVLAQSGDINSKASIVKDGAIEIHCWDGRRFLLEQHPDDHAYSPKSGKPITRKHYRRRYGKKL